MHKKGGNRSGENRSFGYCEYTNKSKNKQIFIDRVINDRVRSDRVRNDRVRNYWIRYDRVRNDWVRNDLVRNDRGLEMIGSQN